MNDKKIEGQDILDMQRFAEDVHHMLIYDVITDICPAGVFGERKRIFLSEDGYRQALDSFAKDEIEIISHAKVKKGDLFYDSPDMPK